MGNEIKSLFIIKLTNKVHIGDKLLMKVLIERNEADDIYLPCVC